MDRRIFTAEEKSFLRKVIPGRSHAQITALFNEWSDNPITADKVKSFIKNHHLYTGRTGRFEKGSVPVNKGKKGVCSKGCEKTWFKKGNEPKNTLPVGSERVNTDGYVEIKISATGKYKWRGKHMLIWEAAYGSIPKGRAIIFADGNKKNVTLDNLISVTRAELAMLNRYHLIGAAKELTQAGIIVADTIMKINERAKNMREV